MPLTHNDSPSRRPGRLGRVARLLAAVSAVLALAPGRLAGLSGSAVAGLAGCQKSAAPTASKPREAAKDLVCGMEVTVGAEGVVAVLHKGRTYHFCSADCADTFKKDPAKYLTKAGAALAPSPAGAAAAPDAAQPKGATP